MIYYVEAIVKTNITTILTITNSIKHHHHCKLFLIHKKFIIISGKIRKISEDFWFILHLYPTKILAPLMYPTEILTPHLYHARY